MAISLRRLFQPDMLYKEPPEDGWNLTEQRFTILTAKKPTTIQNLNFRTLLPLKLLNEYALVLSGALLRKSFESEWMVRWALPVFGKVAA